MTSKATTGPVRKSSFSGGHENCVGLAPTPTGWAVLDLKNPTGGTLHFPRTAITHLTRRA